MKAIKMILKDGKLNVLPQEEEERAEKEPQPGMAINIVETRERETAVENRNSEIAQESREDKSRRLQWLLQQLIRETLLENNQELCREIKESVVKELDYQFRAQEEREEIRDKVNAERNEEYYKRMDDLLRKKSRKLLRGSSNGEPEKQLDQGLKANAKEPQPETRAKKKRHSIF